MTQITNQNQAIAQLIKQQNRKRFVKRSKSGLVGASILIIAAVLIYFFLVETSKEVDRHALVIAAQVQLDAINAQQENSFYHNAKGGNHE